MSNERFWSECYEDQPLGEKVFTLPWVEQELRLDALDNDHPWFNEISPFVHKLMDPFILIRFAPQLIREAFPYREGGVYTTYEVELFKAIPTTERVKVTGRVAEKYEKRGGKYVAFEVTFLDEQEAPVMRVKFHTLNNVAEVLEAKRKARAVK